MDKLKRIATLVLAVCLIVTTIPTSVYADVGAVQNQIGEHFEVNDQTGALPATPGLRPYLLPVRLPPRRQVS